jgi:hypothetical protein
LPVFPFTPKPTVLVARGTILQFSLFSSFFDRTTFRRVFDELEGLVEEDLGIRFVPVVEDKAKARAAAAAEEGITFRFVDEEFVDLRIGEDDCFGFRIFEGIPVFESIRRGLRRGDPSYTYIPLNTQKTKNNGDFFEVM